MEPSEAKTHHSLCVTPDGRVLLRLLGEIDMDNADRIEETLRSVTRQGPPELVLDLQGVTFLDAVGVRLILLAHRWQERAGNDLKVVLGNGDARRVLEVMRLKLVLRIEDG